MMKQNTPRALVVRLFIAAFGLGLVQLECASAQHGPPAASVRVDAARLERVQEQRLVTGELRAVQRSRVAAEEAGIVLSMAVEQGRAVKKGETLAQLDSQRLAIELQQSEADRQVASAAANERQAELDWRQRDLENYQGLAAGGAGKAKELYDAEMAVKVAQAKIESARRGVDAIAAQVELLKKRIADATIVAPFDGVIVSKIAEEGEWLAEGAAVVEMIAIASVDAWLDVPQQYADAIIGHAEGPSVTIMIEASDRRIETSNLRVIPQVDPKARTFAVVARLNNAENLLAVGMSVTAYVPTGESGERLTISRDAIMRGPTGAYVYVARQTQPDAPPSAVPADVQVLFAAGERVVVQSPAIQPGDTLVVEGNERLFPMAPIIPQAGETSKSQNVETSKPPEAPAS